MKIIFATHNPGKLLEMQKIMSPIEVVGPEDFGIFEEPEETGQTFTDNAFIKADFVFKQTNLLTIADDSGLCIDALDGRPGVFSKRYAGENSTGQQKIDKIMSELAGVKISQRGASFITAAVIVGEGIRQDFTGQIIGIIPESPKGEFRDKLPFDVIFQPEGFDKTFAEMTSDEKNSISHRGLAFSQLKEYLLTVL